MKRRSRALTGALVAVGLVLLTASPTWAGSNTLTPLGCSGSSKLYSGSTTMGDTSHNIWTSINNNQGKWWPGDGVWRSRQFYSTKSSASAVNFTWGSHQLTYSGCYTP